MAMNWKAFNTALFTTLAEGNKERIKRRQDNIDEDLKMAKLYGLPKVGQLKSKAASLKSDIDYLKGMYGDEIDDAYWIAMAGGKSGVTLNKVKSLVQTNGVNNLTASDLKGLVNLNGYVAPTDKDLDYTLEQLVGLHQGYLKKDKEQGGKPSDKKSFLAMMKAGFATNPRLQADEYLENAKMAGMPVNELISLINSTGKGDAEGLSAASPIGSLYNIEPITMAMKRRTGSYYKNDIIDSILKEGDEVATSTSLLQDGVTIGDWTFSGSDEKVNRLQKRQAEILQETLGDVQETLTRKLRIDEATVTNQLRAYLKEMKGKPFEEIVNGLLAMKRTEEEEEIEKEETEKVFSIDKVEAIDTDGKVRKAGLTEEVFFTDTTVTKEEEEKAVKEATEFVTNTQNKTTDIPVSDIEFLVDSLVNVSSKTTVNEIIAPFSTENKASILDILNQRKNLVSEISTEQPAPEIIIPTTPLQMSDAEDTLQRLKESEFKANQIEPIELSEEAKRNNAILNSDSEFVKVRIAGFISSYKVKLDDLKELNLPSKLFEQNKVSISELSPNHTKDDYGQKLSASALKSKFKFVEPKITAPDSIVKSLDEQKQDLNIFLKAQVLKENFDPKKIAKKINVNEATLSNIRDEEKARILEEMESKTNKGIMSRSTEDPKKELNSSMNLDENTSLELLKFIADSLEVNSTTVSKSKVRKAILKWAKLNDYRVVSSGIKGYTNAYATYLQRMLDGSDQL
tara:strand:+ start:2374 stop:4590 length:2217 start_codon:yes stop_codon:yes gene_type:complete